MTAVLKSRIPEVIAGLKPRTEAALKVGAEAIEAGAKEGVRRRSGALHDAIHTEKVAGGYAVIAGDDNVFWGHLLEHGTVHSPPHPFLVPSFEAEKEGIAESVVAAITSL